MEILIQTIIYIISIIGIFVLFFIFTDDDIELIKSKNENKKVLNIDMYNIDDDELKIFIEEIEKNEKISAMVDIVNIEQRFDK